MEEMEHLIHAIMWAQEEVEEVDDMVEAEVAVIAMEAAHWVEVEVVQVHH